MYKRQVDARYDKNCAHVVCCFLKLKMEIRKYNNYWIVCVKTDSTGKIFYNKALFDIKTIDIT